jgi:hypothetical protein
VNAHLPFSPRQADIPTETNKNVSVMDSRAVKVISNNYSTLLTVFLKITSFRAPDAERFLFTVEVAVGDGPALAFVMVVTIQRCV